MDTGRALNPRAIARPGAVAVVGCGNIGSQAVPLLAMLPFIGRIDLIDFDHYEHANLGQQRFAATEVGRAKARVQAQTLRRLRPEVDVRASSVASSPFRLASCAAARSCPASIQVQPARQSAWPP